MEKVAEECNGINREKAILNRWGQGARQGGFTMVELLAVLIIVAILAAVGTPIYFKYVDSARASDAQTTIGAILTAEKVHYQKFGRYTGRIEELDVTIDESTLLNWNFEVGATEDKLNTIQATSTEDMPAGAGKVVRYEVRTGKFSGYGTD